VNEVPIKKDGMHAGGGIPWIRRAYRREDGHGGSTEFFVVASPWTPRG
jgi:hypothetical protein